jgi:hypothetical protein
MHEKPQRLGVMLRQSQPGCRLLGQSGADLAVIFNVPLAQIVQHGRQVQHGFVFDRAIDFAGPARIGQERREMLHDAN